MRTLISPIRHILQPAGKYGFRAICAHIKKISKNSNSLKQCQCGGPNHDSPPISYEENKRRFCKSFHFPMSIYA